MVTSAPPVDASACAATLPRLAEDSPQEIQLYRAVVEQSHGRFTPLYRSAARAPALRTLRRTRLAGAVVQAHYGGQAVEESWPYTLRELSGRVAILISFAPRRLANVDWRRTATVSVAGYCR